MLYKCANPRCSILFRKMNEGRIFRLPQVRPATGKNLRRTAASLEYFWLCDHCALFFSPAFCADSGLMVVPAPGLTARSLHIPGKALALRIGETRGRSNAMLGSNTR